MTMLHLVRHGECVNNVLHIWGGDSSLTEKGERQVRETAECLRNAQFENIFHSPKKRAVRTAEIIAEIFPGTRLIQVPELTERDYGKLEGLNLEETERKFPGMKPKGGAALYYGKLEGENYEDIRNRVRDFLGRLYKEERIDSVIVGHQMTNRAILGELLNLPIEKIPFIKIPNDAVYKIDLKSRAVWVERNGSKLSGLVDIKGNPLFI